MRFFISLHFHIHIIDLSDIQQIQLADIDSFLILGKMSLRRIVPHMLIRSLLKQCIDVPVDIPLDHVIVQAGLCQLSDPLVPVIVASLKMVMPLISIPGTMFRMFCTSTMALR